ncbi:MAG TPA: hypothetical protein VJB94_04170 [Candidatus Nanoarchaeia archaeon]|nr:hypothetical protein [Candidatus Nanoarchaeia archaeon]
MAILLLDGTTTDLIDAVPTSDLTIAGFNSNPKLMSIADPSYLVNFPQNLPGGYKRDHRDKTRTLRADIEDFAKASDFPIEKIALDNFAHTSLHSQKRLEQSLNQFFTSIDEAIVKNGLKETDILNLRKEINEATFMATSRAKTQELRTLVKPVYLTLRDEGFTHYDLIQ